MGDDPGIQKPRKGNVQILHCIQNQSIDLSDIQSNCLKSAMDKRINRLNRDLILLNCGTTWTVHYPSIVSILIGISSALNTGDCLCCWWVSSDWSVQAEAGCPLEKMLIWVPALATHSTKTNKQAKTTKKKKKQALMACIASSRVEFFFWQWK